MQPLRFRFFAALLLLLFNNPLLANNEGSAVIFMYHHFGDERYPSTNIQLQQFDDHLTYLKSEGFHILPLEQLLATLRSGDPLPDRSVAITMDDAYRSIYSEAYPRLKKLGWPFTVFVSSDYIDKKFSNYLSWEQMREMQQHGASFANHSATHDHLTQVKKGESSDEWRRRITADLQRATRRLKEELGEENNLFAYPYGEYNNELATIIESLGLTAFGQHSGAIGRHSDPRALPRFPMAEAFAGMDGFRTKAQSLSLPVIAITPWSPVTTDRRPILSVTLERPYLQQLTCYASGQGKIDIKWLSEERKQFTVQALEPLPTGRSRYNCTAPSSEDGRFYWFSQPWIYNPKITSIEVP